MREAAVTAARPLRILCDCDGVLADFVGLILDYVARNTGLTYEREAVNEWDCLQCLGLSDHWPYFREQCDRLNLCRDMRPLPGAAEFYAELGRLGHVRVCTTPMTPAWLTQRAEWLIDFGVPLLEQMQIHEKHALAGGAEGYDVLIDDRVENCEAFVRAGGRAFCLAAEYNTHVAPHVPRGTHARCLAWLRAYAKERERIARIAAGRKDTPT
jgi:5'(3')-deoxyribonucleotidase